MSLLDRIKLWWRLRQKRYLYGVDPGGRRWVLAEVFSDIELGEQIYAARQKPDNSGWHLSYKKPWHRETDLGVAI